jgi:hypothetical protein
LLDYLPQEARADPNIAKAEPEAEPEGAKVEQECADTAESRAQSRKQKKLAELEQAQAADRKQRFVFGRSASLRGTPTRKKGQGQSLAEVREGQAAAQANK